MVSIPEQMKLKIVHQNQESRGGGEEQQMKKEAVEKAEIPVSSAEEAVKEDISVEEPSPVSAAHPLLLSVSFFLCLQCVDSCFGGCLFLHCIRSALVCWF